MSKNTETGNRSENRREEMFRHVEAWEVSGLSQRQYCHQQGFSVSTFSYWRKRHRSDTAGEDTSAGFLPLTLPPSKETLRQVEVDLPGGIILRLVY